MIIDTYFQRLAQSSHKWIPRWLQISVAKVKTATLLYQAIRQTGAKRTLWLLGYVGNVLGGDNSVRQKLPVDRTGYPLPWYTYPAIEYLHQLDFSRCVVFEYGSGNGSQFWARRSQSVTSIECDTDWYETGANALASNQKLLLVTEKGEYVDAIHLGDSCYDVIIIDGVHRFNCAVEAIKRAKHGGFIILDNTDWHPRTAEYLRTAGWSQIDFIGTGPINPYAWCTSIFFRERMLIPRRLDQDSVAVMGGVHVEPEAVSC